MISAIFGIKGLSLSDGEVSFFKKYEPYGFILFARNCQSKEQIQALTQSLHSMFPERDIPILIDQEGGRVARIKPPISYKKFPAAYSFTLIQQEYGLEAAKSAVYENYRELMQELIELGINVTCAPVADLLIDGAHSIIGDRSFGSDPHIVAELCLSALEGIESVGGNGVIKHIPGHGRALCDSHHDLPIVSTALDVLKETDFKPFQLIGNKAKFAMTAHVVYSDIDYQPATLSPLLIQHIRNDIGFTGCLMTDDLSMKALKGDLGNLARIALESGCNIALHCNGDMEEMLLIAQSLTTTRKM